MVIALSKALRRQKNFEHAEPVKNMP